MQYDIQKIDDARIKRGWTKSKLALLAGMSKGTMTHIFTHKKVVKPETYKRLAETLGLTMDDICIEETNHARNRG